MPVRRKLIRSLVDRVLDQVGSTDAPVPIEKIAKMLGAEIRRQPTDASMSGFLLREAATDTVIIGVNKSQHPHRQRFTIAHEVGHLLLHPGERMYVDGATCGMVVKRRDELSSEGTDSEEIEANLFAAEILMPHQMLERDVASFGALDLVVDNDLKPLADKYGVSIQALTYRLLNLGLLAQ